MYMKAFLVALKQCVKKDYPDIEFEFYLSRRSKFAHMGLDLPLISVKDHQKLIKFIQEYWEQNKEDNMFSFSRRDLYLPLNINLTILYLKNHSLIFTFVC